MYIYHTHTHVRYCILSDRVEKETICHPQRWSAPITYNNVVCFQKEIHKTAAIFTRRT